MRGGAKRATANTNSIGDQKECVCCKSGRRRQRTKEAAPRAHNNLYLCVCIIKIYISTVIYHGGIIPECTAAIGIALIFLRCIATRKSARANLDSVWRNLGAGSQKAAAARLPAHKPRPTPPPWPCQRPSLSLFKPEHIYMATGWLVGQPKSRSVTHLWDSAN